MNASRTLAAGHSSEMGLYEVPCDESWPGLGIGMTNDVFQIDGRRQDLKTLCKGKKKIIFLFI